MRYKFRGKRIDNSEWVYGSFAHCHDEKGNPSIIPSGDNRFFSVATETVGQFTGLKDKNGKEIYEGDVLRVRRPGRDQQTHYGDNIPLGEYTEPLEPIINEYETVVKFIDGMFGYESESEDHLPLKWIFVDTFAGNEDELKEMFSGGWGHRIFEGWDDDLEYLYDQYKVSSVEELIKYIGVEIIGNTHSNPELLGVKA